ncbi:AraC-like DNA-binding protein [Nicoletella semolina]|uniref:AraC-like DNA-binding protein n=1 Tax=Nicoletella semolina TaxID=271160 RepID=A0A4R2N6Z7_9PAST|nr:AraC family transcriptional regulator [Nicoletella semolina]MDH2924683.1 AraC family transcriptional regulator [Nicoletella semolina]TCP16693.1 AraC-like DNA-binding protein [Nicoletella semolina]
MDAITYLFSHFQFNPDLFFLGQLCRTGHFDQKNKGYLHFIRNGRCWLNQVNDNPKLIDRPCIVFSPTNVLHSIHPLDSDGIDVFCINFDFGEGVRNPLTTAVDTIVVLFLDEQPQLAAITDLIFTENTQQRCGYHAAIHHLSAYFIIEVVRCCIEQQYLQTGLLRGLMDNSLSKVLLAIHKQPERTWQIDELAKIALMSTSAFSTYFKEIMGISPMEYLTHWRISVAQSLLQKGVPVARVAEQVGYSHNAALTRVFIRELGVSPTKWLSEHQRG